MWDYTDEVKEHFFNPRNVGEIENPDAVGEVGSMACGDALKLMLSIDGDGKITDVKYQTFGCGSAIAAASALSEMIMGKTVDEAEKITNNDIADFLGGLPEQKMHCSVLGREALEAALNNYRTGADPDQKEKGTVVCTCFGITEKEIRRVVTEDNLHTVEQVTNYCKAGGGCQGCHPDIEAIIEDVHGVKVSENGKLRMEEEPPPAKKPLTNIQKIQMIQQTLDQQVRPALQADGGDVELIDVEGNNVIVSFRGMCAQCNLAEFTLSDVVQAKLREFVSEELTVQEQV